MDKLREFLGTDKGKFVGITAGAVMLLLILWVITPNTQNIVINCGDDYVVSTKSAKKNNKHKRAKSQKKNKK